MSEKMPSPEILDKIQKENLTDKQIEKDKIREEAYDAGNSAGRKEIKQEETAKELYDFIKGEREGWVLDKICSLSQELHTANPSLMKSTCIKAIYELLSEELEDDNIAAGRKKFIDNVLSETNAKNEIVSSPEIAPLFKKISERADLHDKIYEEYKKKHNVSSSSRGNHSYVPQEFIDEYKRSMSL